MSEKPYVVINTSNNEIVGRMTYEEAVLWQGVPNFDVIYRPGRKTKSKKEFPYNG